MKLYVSTYKNYLFGKWLDKPNQTFSRARESIFPELGPQGLSKGKHFTTGELP